MYCAHWFAGALIGYGFQKWQPKTETFVKREYALPVVGFIAGALPDFPAMLQIAISWASGKAADYYVSDVLANAAEVLHKFFFWTALAVILGILFFCKFRQSFRLLATVTACASTALAHVLIDAMTHGRELDPERHNYFWPLDFEHSGALGVWHYQQGRPFLQLRSEEVVIVLLLMAAILFIDRIRAAKRPLFPD